MAVQQPVGKLVLRSGTPGDADAAASICYTAFEGINSRHGFPPDFREEEARAMLQMCLANPHVSSIIAERDGNIVGSNFLWHGTIGGIGPITVDSGIQDAGVGRQLMQRAIEIADERKMPGVRLVQAAFNGRSLSLYTKLGFDVREPLVCLNGKPIRQNITGHKVRAMKDSDVQACSTICTRVHGHERNEHLMMGLMQGDASVVERDGEITGYASGIGFFNHAVAIDNVSLMALIAAAEKITGPGLLLPMRNSELFRWCLDGGLRYVQAMTLMSRGVYTEPRGAFLPSILF